MIINTMPAISGALSFDLDDFAGGGVVVEVELAEDDDNDNDELPGVVYFIINITL